jgi:hypothetical protein
MRGKLPLKPFDFLVVGIAVALTGFSAFAVYTRPQASQQVIIQGASGRAWVYPLDAEETVAVQGPLGNTVVRIHNHQAWVESSPCDNQTCVAAGHINSEGEWVACLPNNVFLLIEGAGNDTGNLDSSAW